MAIEDNGPSNGSQGTGAPEALTEDRINEILNRAITARLQDYSKRHEKNLTAIMETITSRFDERLQSSLQKPEGEQKPSTFQESPEFKGYLKRQQEIEEELKAAKEENRARKAQALDSTLRQKLGDVLAKHGIDAKASKLAVNAIVDGDKRVRWSEDESRMVWRDDDGADIDVELGVKAWSKTDEAKYLQAPRNISGSGGAPNRGGQQQQGATQDTMNNALLGMLGLPTGAGG